MSNADLKSLKNQFKPKSAPEDGIVYTPDLIDHVEADPNSRISKGSHTEDIPTDWTTPSTTTNR